MQFASSAVPARRRRVSRASRTLLACEAAAFTVAAAVHFGTGFASILAVLLASLFVLVRPNGR
ncbi:MAG: hypothetical protein ACM3ML_31295 [Micromonosporaceae bacterium]